jgi:hypothetical protein
MNRQFETEVDEFALYRWDRFNLHRHIKRIEDQVDYALRKHGGLFGVTISELEVQDPRTHEWRAYGQWVDDYLFPPDPMEIMAKHVNQVLADRE